MKVEDIDKIMKLNLNQNNDVFKRIDDQHYYKDTKRVRSTIGEARREY